MFYSNYLKKSKELGVQEFGDEEITEEDKEKRNYYQLLKKKMLKKCILYNKLAEITLVAIVAFNDGIIVLPFLAFLIIIFSSYLFQTKAITHFKVKIIY